MDKNEGILGAHYSHERVVVVTDSGQQVTAETYIAGSDFICAESAPSQDYLQRILSGARHHNLPEDYVQRIEKLGKQPSPA